MFSSRASDWGSRSRTRRLAWISQRPGRSGPGGGFGTGELGHVTDHHLGGVVPIDTMEALAVDGIQQPDPGRVQPPTQYLELADQPDRLGRINRLQTGRQDLVQAGRDLLQTLGKISIHQLDRHTPFSHGGCDSHSAGSAAADPVSRWR